MKEDRMAPSGASQLAADVAALLLELSPAKDIKDFCWSNKMSRSHYYNMRNSARGPRETWVNGKVIILPIHELEWRRAQHDLPINQAKAQKIITEGVRRRARENLTKGRKRNCNA